MRMNPKKTPIFNDRPFEGQGASLYLNGLYRKLRVIPRGCWLRQGDDLQIGADSVLKTARIGSTAETSGNDVDVTADLTAHASSTVTLDLRHYKDDVEREAVHPIQLTLDGSGDQVAEILGAYALLNTEILAGGIVRIHFEYIAASNGIAPETFKISRTAGPTSPADVEIDYEGTGSYEIDTTALSDASAYTFDVIADNATLSISRTLGEVTVTADATGPSAVSSLTVEAW